MEHPPWMQILFRGKPWIFHTLVCLAVDFHSWTWFEMGWFGPKTGQAICQGTDPLGRSNLVSILFRIPATIHGSLSRWVVASLKGLLKGPISGSAPISGAEAYPLGRWTNHWHMILGKIHCCVWSLQGVAASFFCVYGMILELQLFEVRNGESIGNIWDGEW